MRRSSDLHDDSSSMLVYNEDERPRPRRRTVYHEEGSRLTTGPWRAVAQAASHLEQADSFLSDFNRRLRELEVDGRGEGVRGIN